MLGRADHTGLISQARLRELLTYNPETGIFCWAELSGTRKSGPRGKRLPTGYLLIVLDGQSYYLHRLAWLWVNGTHPEHNIDHINGKRDDNRIANLRDVPQAVNLRNTRKARSSCGLLGVARSRGRFVAQIRVNGAKVHLGVFDTAEKAHVVFIAKRNELFPVPVATASP